MDLKSQLFYILGTKLIHIKDEEDVHHNKFINIKEEEESTSDVYF